MLYLCNNNKQIEIMTFKKTSLTTWEANKKDTNYFIDNVSSNKKHPFYYLTITKENETILNDISFFKLNEAKQYAKQY